MVCLFCLSTREEQNVLDFFLAFVPELWLLLVTTDLDVSKPERSTLCSASVEA